MALGIVKYFYDRPSQPIGVIWFVVSLFSVSMSRSVVVDAAATFSCYISIFFSRK